MKRVFLLFLILLSFSSFSQLGVVGADEASDLVPKGKENEERKLELPKKETLHPEIALIVAELGISGALLDKQLSSKKSDLFKSNRKDIQELAKEYSLYSQLMDSLDDQMLAKVIDSGAESIEPITKSDCMVSPEDDSVPCNGKTYVKKDPLEEKFIPQLQDLKKLTPAGTEVVGSPKVGPKIEKDQRNLMVITMANALKKRRMSLEGLVQKGLLSEIKLKDLAFLKKSFESYQEKMSRYISRVSRESKLEGQCEITPGEIEVDCYGEKFVLVQKSRFGEQASEEGSQNQHSRSVLENGNFDSSKKVSTPVLKGQ